jgi:hypothetical protein
MEESIISFNEYIKKLDIDEKTPVGIMRLKYIELNPDAVFNPVNGIKCIGSLDSEESLAWSRFLMREAYGYILKPYSGFFHKLKGIEEGGHIVIAEWVFNTYHAASLKKKGSSKFKEEYRLQVLSKLGLNFTLVEKEALCSYLLLRNNYMKYRDMFKPNKLLALQLINRFAKENSIRFEDAEAVLRGYIH